MIFNLLMNYSQVINSWLAFILSIFYWVNFSQNFQLKPQLAHLNLFVDLDGLAATPTVPTNFHRRFAWHCKNIIDQQHDKS